jgi:hypothetical protein
VLSGELHNGLGEVDMALLDGHHAPPFGSVVRDESTPEGQSGQRWPGGGQCNPVLFTVALAQVHDDFSHGFRVSGLLGTSTGSTSAVGSPLVSA